MEATGADLLWTILGGLVTLAIYSFLYRDNPFYKMAEHLAVGISVGFIILIYYETIFMPKVWDNILHNGQYDYVIPLAFGLLLFTRFIPKQGWMSRWSIAFLLGASSGLSIPMTLEGRVLEQLNGSIRSLVSLDPSGTLWENFIDSFSAIFLVVGTLACLVFFYFSKEHRGAVGRVAYFGRLCIMAGFGASFGYTVMARVSLLIGRMQYLTRDFADALGRLF